MRIRNNREFFNITPVEALNILKRMATMLEDAEVEEVFKQVVIGRNDKSSVEKSTAPREKSVVWRLPANRKFFDVDGCLFVSIG